MSDRTNRTTVTMAGQTAWITPGSLNSFETTPEVAVIVPQAVNENNAAVETPLFPQLPADIRAAVDEWATHLSGQDWHLRRRAIQRFAQAFADNFLAVQPELTDEEYDSLHDIGLTCILERMDDGLPFTSVHQARAFGESVHEIHRARAAAYLDATMPSGVTVH